MCILLEKRYTCVLVITYGKNRLLVQFLHRFKIEYKVQNRHPSFAEMRKGLGTNIYRLQMDPFKKK